MTTHETKYGTCPDCGKPTEEVGLSGVGPVGAVHYFNPEAEPSFWSGQAPMRGAIIAYRCSGCGRMYLYGRDYKKEERDREEPRKEDGRLSVIEDAGGEVSPTEDGSARLSEPSDD